MQESQSHCPMKVSEAMIVGIDEVEGQGPLNWTAATPWWSPYQPGPVTTSMLHQSHVINMLVSDEGN